MRKVLVSGCFDMMHSGHIAFLKTAADFGQVFACIGSDETVFSLKGRYPIINQSERAFCLDALDSVFQARVSRGSGHLDFLPELLDIKPDIFVVNADGDSTEKQALMAQHGIEYFVLDRIPAENLPPRSTTALRTICDIPYRLDLAGGWLDQPFVNALASGPVITISVEPTHDFNNRSGMSSSTRKAAIELWKTQIPDGNRELLAKTLFCFENPPGTKDVAGSQDAIGVVFPGLNCIEYGEPGSYWPSRIETILNDDVLAFLESRLWLLPLGERKAGYSVLENTRIETAAAAALAAAAANLFLAATNKDACGVGKAMTASFEAQVEMFPNMTSISIQNTIQQCYTESPSILGHKLSGAGGGGYLVLFSEYPIDNTLQIKIRREAN
ncbi:MAG: adenylyltransferase/cytidyltransferase family protein [Bacteroidota bacterium]